MQLHCLTDFSKARTRMSTQSRGDSVETYGRVQVSITKEQGSNLRFPSRGTSQASKQS